MKSIKIVLLAVVASLMFVGCGNNAKTPSEIAIKVLEASKNLDFATVKKYVVKKRIERLEKAEREMKEDVERANEFKNETKNVTFKVLSETISEDGNSAVVLLEVFFDGERNQKDMDFVKVDGEWKVDEHLY